MQTRLVRYVGVIADYPSRALFSWYLGLIAVGTLLLLLPACRAPGVAPFGFVDALFTATSAATVTGLMVLSVESQLSFTGQAVVLALIQLGGFGIMSIGTLLFVSATGRQPVRFHVLTKETLGAPLGADVKRLILLVAAVTITVEAVGAIALLLARLGDGPFLDVLWWAVFHAVSGFCNSGISLQDASLAPWAGDPAVILVMTGLIIAGGLGFPVLLDLRHVSKTGRDRRSLRFHTRLVVTATLILVIGGTIAIWWLERGHALAHMAPVDALVNALFQSVTTRSAGFSTLPIESMVYPSLFVLMLLMLIGGSSCSTAGGIKVPTVSVLVLQAKALLRHDWQMNAFHRRVSDRALLLAVTVTATYLVVLTLGAALLLVLETRNMPRAAAQGEFLDVVFEAISALGTVGLSTGATGRLSEAGQVVVVLMMLFGRVGPLAMASSLLRRPQGPKIRYPQSEVIIG